jgi:hypothetical protein
VRIQITCPVSRYPLLVAEGDGGWLTSTEAAALLGMPLRTFQRIPREELPYEQTSGGARRSGRRKYRRADVEQWTPGPGRSHEQRITDLERRLADVERRLGK